MEMNITEINATEMSAEEMNTLVVKLQEKVSLRETIMRAYTIKYPKGDFSKNSVDPKTFESSSRDKIKCILKEMGIEFKEFKGKNGHYKIPLLISLLFISFLTQPSNKNSLISLIKLGQHSKISYKQTAEAINTFYQLAQESFVTPEESAVLNRVCDIMKMRALRIRNKRDLHKDLHIYMYKKLKNFFAQSLDNETYVDILKPSLRYKKVENEAKDFSIDHIPLNLDNLPEDMAERPNGEEELLLIEQLFKYMDITFDACADITKRLIEERNSDIEDSAIKWCAEQGAELIGVDIENIDIPCDISLEECMQAAEKEFLKNWEIFIKKYKKC